MSTSPKPGISPVYDRTDPRGHFPMPEGYPDLEHNRLALFWRPLIDMRPSPYAPMRLQAIEYVNRWLADPDSREWAWFARHSVPGLRNQVIRHAGLAVYACHDPRDLAVERRSPQWRVLVDAIDGFAALPPLRRRLVIFQLVQMSFYDVAVALAAEDRRDGTRETDLYLYEVARAHTNVRAGDNRALALFRCLAVEAEDHTLRLAAAGQGISRAVRRERDLDTAREFEALGKAAYVDADEWLSLLMRSRFHRAVALLRLREREFSRMRTEADLAWELGEALFTGLAEGPDMYVAVENRRIILESLIKAAGRAPDGQPHDRLRALCDRLLAIDPCCIQARLVVADGYAAAGAYDEAAHWYTRAGELGTGAGAMAWYRAGQCYDLLGRPADAANAMGRCLELDTTAVQPRRYLERTAPAPAPAPAPAA